MADEKTALVEACTLIGKEALRGQQGDGADAAALANYPYTGKAVISIILVGVGKIQVTANFDNGEKLEYNAWVYGPIAGAGGISFGGGAFALSPSDLLKGSMGCALALTIAGVVITFFRDGKIVGSFVGGGPNVGVGEAAGSGDWKRV